MTALSERNVVLALVAEAVEAGARQERACHVIVGASLNLTLHAKNHCPTGIHR